MLLGTCLAKSGNTIEDWDPNYIPLAQMSFNIEFVGVEEL